MGGSLTQLTIIYTFLSIKATELNRSYWQDIAHIYSEKNPKILPPSANPFELSSQDIVTFYRAVSIRSPFSFLDQIRKILDDLDKGIRVLNYTSPALENKRRWLRNTVVILSTPGDYSEHPLCDVSLVRVHLDRPEQELPLLDDKEAKIEVPNIFDGVIQALASKDLPQILEKLKAALASV